MDKATQLLEPTTHPPISGQQKWRTDFPVDQAQDVFIARRDFTKFLVLISSAFVFGQFWIVLKSLIQRNEFPTLIKRKIVSVDSIPIGGSLVFEYPGPNHTCVLIRLSEQNYLAYSNKCTHLMCPIIPEVKEERLHCPCHHGLFDLKTGIPIAGPPRRALTKINLSVENGEIFAIGVLQNK